jgi:hypothetical protein
MNFYKGKNEVLPIYVNEMNDRRNICNRIKELLYYVIIYIDRKNNELLECIKNKLLF